MRVRVRVRVRYEPDRQEDHCVDGGDGGGGGGGGGDGGGVMGWVASPDRCRNNHEYAPAGKARRIGDKVEETKHTYRIAIAASVKLLWSFQEKKRHCSRKLSPKMGHLARRWSWSRSGGTTRNWGALIVLVLMTASRVRFRVKG